MVSASSVGEGDKEPTGCSQPGDAGDAIDVVVHEEEQRQKSDPIADRSDHHPFIAVSGAFFERATIDSEDEEGCWDKHAPHDIELLATGTLTDDL